MGIERWNRSLPASELIWTFGLAKSHRQINGYLPVARVAQIDLHYDTLFDFHAVHEVRLRR